MFALTQNDKLYEQKLYSYKDFYFSSLYKQIQINFMPILYILEIN